jgi:TatD DNase family protein
LISEGKIIACCISEKKGVPKREVSKVILVENYGVQNDAHAGGDRQVSLLSIADVKNSGIDAPPGGFGENLLVEGIDFSLLKPGIKIALNSEVILEVTQIGKKCHSKCTIFYKTGKCIMPSRGVFARVLRGGEVQKGMSIRIYEE